MKIDIEIPTPLEMTELKERSMLKIIALTIVNNLKAYYKDEKSVVEIKLEIKDYQAFTDNTKIILMQAVAALSNMFKQKGWIIKGITHELGDNDDGYISFNVSVKKD